MPDRIARYELGFGPDAQSAGDIASFLRGIKNQFTSTVASIEATTKRADLFAGVEKSVQAASAALVTAKNNVNVLTKAIEAAKAAGSPTRELEQGLKAAQAQAATATREFDKQVTSLTRLQNQLAKAGVDTNNLASEQLRLAEAHKAATAAAAEQSAKSLLQVKTTADVKASVDKLQAAYATLRDTGRLTFSENNAALAALKTRIAEAKGGTDTLGGAFLNLKTQIVAFGATFAGVAIALRASQANAREFATDLAKVGTVSDVSKEQLDALGAGARDLARTIGFDVTKGLESLYAILRAGIPSDNALEVLRLSADAAKAGITDLGSATALSTTLINAFKIPVADLGKALDVAFQGAKDGGATIAELSASIGAIAPVARAANVPFEQIIASLTVLRRAGIETPDAIGGLQRAILALGAPTADGAVKLRALGIQTKDFLSVLQQISGKRISLDVLRDLVDGKTLKVVAALTDNFAGLNTELGQLGASAGGITKVNEALDLTPEEKVEKFHAAIKDLSLAFGDFVGAGSSNLLPTLTGLLNGFNGLTASSKDAAISLTGTVAGAGALYLSLKSLAVPINLVAAALPNMRLGFLGVAAGADAAAVSVKLFGVAVAGLLGYEVGKWAREQFEPVRVVGDFLGTLFAGAVNEATFAVSKLFNSFTSNAAGLRAAETQYQRNADILRGQFAEAVTGAGVRLEALNAKLKDTRTAAVSAASGLVDAVGKMRGAVQQELGTVDGRIDKLRSELGGLADSLQKSVTAQQAAAQQSLANLAAETQQRLAILGTRKLTEAQLEKETIAIQLDAAAQRLAIIQKLSADTIKAFEAEAATRRALAGKSKDDIAAVELQIAQGKKLVLQNLTDAYRAYVNDLLALEKQHLDRVKAIDAERLAVNADALSKIRDLQRAALSPLDAYSDRLLEIDQNISKSRIALLQGDFKGAEDFAKKAISLSDNVAGEVKDDQGTIVTAYQAQQNAIGRINEALGLYNQASARERQTEVDRAAAAANSYAAAKQQLDELTTKLNTLAATAATGINLQVTGDTTKVTAKLAELDADLKQRTFLASVDGDLSKLQATLTAFRDDIAKNGIPVDLVAKTEGIKTALKEIADEKPSLQLDIDDAMKSLDKLREAETNLKAINLEIKTNEAQIQGQLDKMNLTATVKVNLTGGSSGSDPNTGFNFSQGGPVPAPTHYADGGHVFRKPTWTKVPGIGDQDTVPARLQAGSFVMRKSASRYYGDGLMSALAGVQRFAAGGTVLQPGPIAQAILAGGRPASIVGDLGGDPDLRSLVNDAYRVLSPLIDGAKTLPRSFTGQNLGDALAIILENIVNARTLADAQALLDPVASDAPGIADAITNAHRFNVPIVIGANTPGSGKPTGVSALFAALSASLTRGRSGPAHYAQGGGVDTVPALLTPGEHVMSKPAVDAIARMYGGGLLPAMNAMRIDPGALDRLINLPAPTRPRGYASGGYVDNVRPPTGTAKVRSGGDTYNLNFHSNAPIDEEYVARYVAPAIRNIKRKNGGDL